MPGHPPLLLTAIVLAGCAAPALDGTAPASMGALPSGARMSPGGYLTILEAPALPFPAEPPPEPQAVDDFARRTSSRDPAVRAKAWEDANGSPAFQTELERLRQVIAREEPDNFVEVRLVRDPAVAAEFWFKREAAQTLARYTSDPRFRPRQGGLNQAELARLQALWVGRSGEGALITTVGVDPFTGTVEMSIAVEEAEFRSAAARRGWVLGPELKLHFPKPRLAAFADPALERYVRLFPRESNAKGIQLLAGSTGRIVLEDGCFRLGSRAAGEQGPLVLFGRDTQLALDRQNYLVVLGEEGAGRYRIGEIGSWPGPNGVEETDPQVQALRRQCGGGPIVNVAEPHSERLFGLPDPAWVADYARAKSLTYREAWGVVIECMERQEGRGRRSIEARDRCIDQFN